MAEVIHCFGAILHDAAVCNKEALRKHHNVVDVTSYDDELEIGIYLTLFNDVRDTTTVNQKHGLTNWFPAKLFANKVDGSVVRVEAVNKDGERVVLHVTLCRCPGTDYVFSRRFISAVNAVSWEDDVERHQLIRRVIG